MKSIKTVNLKANEVQAVEMPDLHCHVRNGGTATVFASRYSDVAPYTDGVLEIKSGDSKVVRNIFDYQTRQGFVYLLSESDTSVELESANDVNFFSRKIISGGESTGSVDTYNRSEINAMLSEKADNSDLKTVAKTGSYNDLSDKPEIPVVDVDKSYVDNALKEKADNADVENVSNAVNTHISDISVHMTTTEKEKLAGLENYDDLQVRINTSSIGLSRKNLLKNTAGTKTESGVLFTVNADGSVTAKRTETSESNSYYLINKISLKKGKYIFTGGNSDDRNIPYILIYTYKSDNTYIGAISGNVVFEVMDESMKYGFNINYPTGNSDEVTFYPMLRFADIIDDTYAPYTPSLQEQINDILERLTAGGI